MTYSDFAKKMILAARAGGHPKIRAMIFRAAAAGFPSWIRNQI